MNHTSHSRSGLFLLELIIAILFFALGSAVCIQVFARAHLTSQAARDLSFASRQAQSAASVLRSTGGSLASLGDYYPEAEISGADAVVCFDAGRQPCAPKEADCTMTVRSRDTEGLTEAAITVAGRDGSVIYELALRFPSQPGAAGEEAQP